jgi:hypothetical protein
VIGSESAGVPTYDLPSILARQFRLDIFQASEAPTIEEFELSPPAGKQSK